LKAEPPREPSQYRTAKPPRETRIKSDQNQSNRGDGERSKSTKKIKGARLHFFAASLACNKLSLAPFLNIAFKSVDHQQGTFPTD
jgi:hypothetical protein